MERETEQSVADRVLDPVEREKSAAVTGDAELYFSALAGDALFLPPNTTAKTGAELRSWLKEFIDGFRVEWLRFESSELQVSGEIAYHIYAYRWRVTPVAGGEPTVASGKGLHILRRQPDGSWKIARELWNSTPEG
jgi:ketosteroid isomerase-like protein